MEIKNNRCSDYVLDFISIFDGQYLVYYSSQVDKDNWYERWNQEIQKDKKFYVIGSGNDGDHTDDLLIEIDKILNFFVEKNIDKSKIIFMTPNLNFDYALSNLRSVAKKDGIRLISDWDNVIKQVETESVNHINFCPYFFNVGDHPLDHKFLSQFENQDGLEQFQKLFSATMWSMRISNDILHTRLYESNLIKDLWEIRDEDIGYVSYGLRGRLFEKDLQQPSLKKYGEHEYVGDWREGGDNVVANFIMKSFINLVVESACDYTVENESRYYFKKTQQYYRSRMTSTLFTEKIMFPIILKRPFLIWGGYGCIDALKDLGFKTFDKIFDESYQYERDSDKRCFMITDQLVKLKDKSRDELFEIYHSVEDILNYNHKLLCDSYDNRSLNIAKHIYKQLKGLNFC
tara:strand:- start:1637 stop:2842 length:1206 start_codon:yes stop_codon:yes gene_type:complete